MKKRLVIKTGKAEKIIAHEHHIGSQVELLVAHGDKNSNDPTKFLPTASQNHQELMDEHIVKNKPKGQFRKDDLWKFVDRARGVS
jgi:hypothetical protein